MNILDILIYKNDKITGTKRISKTKIISLIFFVIFFLFSMSVDLADPEISKDITVCIIASIIVGLVFTAPVFIIGWLIGSLLNRSKTETDNTNKANYDYHPNQTKKPTLDFINKNPCPHNNAVNFKNAIDENNYDTATSIISNWENNDANYWYAKIIFDGMPPSNVGLEELKTWLQKADNMQACDENPRQWFRNTAIEVINMR